MDYRPRREVNNRQIPLLRGGNALQHQRVEPYRAAGGTSAPGTPEFHLSFRGRVLRYELMRRFSSAWRCPLARGACGRTSRRWESAVVELSPDPGRWSGVGRLGRKGTAPHL